VEATVLAAWNRPDRRVATGAIVLAAIVAAMGLVLLTRSRDDAGLTLSTPPAHVRPRADGHLVFGMTPQQVLRRTGRPVKTQGDCWLFAPTAAGIVGSISVQPSWSRLPYDPRTANGLKLCFAGGRYSYGYQHIFDPHEQKWVWSAWPLTLMHGTTDYSDY
jgi:hypothetical protein